MRPSTDLPGGRFLLALGICRSIIAFDVLDSLGSHPPFILISQRVHPNSWCLTCAFYNLICTSLWVYIHTKLDSWNQVFIAISQLYLSIVQSNIISYQEVMEILSAMVVVSSVVIYGALTSIDKNDRSVYQSVRSRKVASSRRPRSRSAQSTTPSTPAKMD